MIVFTVVFVELCIAGIIWGIKVCISIQMDMKRMDRYTDKMCEITMNYCDEVLQDFKGEGREA